MRARPAVFRSSDTRCLETPTDALGVHSRLDHDNDHKHDFLLTIFYAVPTKPIMIPLRNEDGYEFLTKNPKWNGR